MTRYYAQRIENAPVGKRQNPQATRHALLVVMASVLLVAGFLLAISQHAEAVKDGYKTQQLMRLRQQLEREKQQLELQRAYYRSPQVIEPLARHMGLVRPDSSQMIVTGTNGEFKRWMPGLEEKAVNGKVARVSGRSGMSAGHSAATGSSSPSGGINAESSERVNRNSTASAVRTRPKRVETAEASVPTRNPEAEAEPNAHVDETPKAWLGGVLTFPEGQAGLKLEKTKKRNKRQN